MKPIHLAFLWHQHQPLYRESSRPYGAVVEGGETCRYVLPWVRLHAIKDYIGMLLVFKEFPAIRATINLVPSLVIQIEEYASGVAEDDCLRLTRKRAEDLDEGEKRYMLDHFFAANPDRLIRVFPRYNELFELRNEAARNPSARAVLHSVASLRDIQVWATLAWFHPLVVESDSVLQALREKGRDFTEDDKRAMLERQDEVIRQVLPLHRELADAGQIEISTSPFYHPILPLLCNMESAREAMPDVPMPAQRADFAADAPVHVERAIATHERVFGRPPTGMWPAEGSVSMDLLDVLRNRGFRWIATDEQILARSAGVDLSRDESGVLRSPDALYQPYSLPGEGELPCIVFRDRVLADAIGFQYHHGEPEPGAEDLLRRIREGAARCEGDSCLVPVILDGENPWDYYGEAGLTFLRTVYRRLSEADDIVTTRLTDFVESHPPQHELEHLAAGSWIDANFFIWIGDQEDRAAWALLAETRNALVARIQQQPPLDGETVRQAWEYIYAAEGSDWFWWFGEDHTSEQDYMFDALFRSYLANVYRLIGEVVPESLSEPIGKPAHDATFTQPTGRLEIVFDGRLTDDLEWAAAGHLAAMEVGSTMSQAAGLPVKDLYYGFTGDRLALRLDLTPSVVEKAHSDLSIVVHITKPATFTLSGGPFPEGSGTLRLLGPDGNETAGIHDIAVGNIIELGCPLRSLAAQPGNAIEFFVEVARAGETVQRIPGGGCVGAVVPTAEHG